MCYKHKKKSMLNIISLSLKRLWGGIRNPGVNLKDYFNNLQHPRLTDIKCNINFVLLGFPVSFPALTCIILPPSEKPQIFSSDPFRQKVPLSPSFRKWGSRLHF